MSDGTAHVEGEKPAEAPLFGAIRRVVTGHDEHLRSTVVRDEMVAPISVQLFGRTGIHWIYGVDELPDLPVQDTIPSQSTYFPPPGGFRFGFLNLPPYGEDSPPLIDMDAAMTELEEKLPGMASHLDPSRAGMHRTATIDAIVVLSGTLTLELDDKAPVELCPGDTVIQVGTRHRWTNRGAVPATLVYFMCGVGDGGCGGGADGQLGVPPVSDFDARDGC